MNPPLHASRLSLLVGAVIATGSLSMLSGVPAVVTMDGWAIWEIALAAAAVFLGEIALLHIRFGQDHYSFTWSETAVVVGLVLLPGGCLRVVAPLAVAAAHLAVRRPAVKVIYNAMSFATGVLIAQLVCQAISGGPPRTMLDDPRTWLALAAGAVVFFLWNGLTVAAAVAASQGLPVRVVFRKGLVLALLVMAGNTGAGVTMVTVGHTEPRIVAALPVFLALLYLADQCYLRAIEESDTWKILQAASRDLVRIDENQVAEVVLERTGSLFGAPFVELLVSDGVPGSQGRLWRVTGDGGVEVRDGAPMDLAGGFWPRSFSEREPFLLELSRAPASQREELAALGLASCVVAPLVMPHGCLGTLRVGFPAGVKLGRRQLQVLATFANHVTSALSTATLFGRMDEERTKLSRVVGHTSDGILSVDRAGAVTSWNPAMAGITGVPEAEALGVPLRSLVDAVDDNGAPLRGDWLSERLAGGDHTEVSIRVAAAGGGWRWLHLSVSAVSVGGEWESAVAVARDVTARREAEEAKRDFIATVSHELRTPLTPLKGFLLTLLRPNYRPTEEELRQHYTRMLHNTQRLERLIEDLLAVSQFDRGSFSVSAAAVNVDDSIEKAVDGLSNRVVHQRAGLQGMAIADASRVEQVVANLVSNAEKYSPADSPILVTVTRGDDSVEVRVTDQGPGIPADQQEAIFDRFHRLGHHLTRRVGGTGLGLYIARRLVDSMGGRIWVESEQGTGSTFVFTLPAASLVAASQAS